MNIAEAAVLSLADRRLSDIERQVLQLLCTWSTEAHPDYQLDEFIATGHIKLDMLAANLEFARYQVFAAVPRLEDFGYLPKGAIR